MLQNEILIFAFDLILIRSHMFVNSLNDDHRIGSVEKSKPSLVSWKVAVVRKHANQFSQEITELIEERIHKDLFRHVLLTSDSFKL